MNKPAVLFIHGFGGGPFEVAPLKRLFRGAGWSCASFSLPGHDMNGRIASSSRAEDYLRAARTAYLRLAKDHRRVAIVGFSMGGLLALLLAAEFSPTHIVIINVPVIPWNISAVLHWLLDDWRKRKPVHAKRFAASATRQNPLTYLQYLRLLFKTMLLARRVTCPCLIAQSYYDDTAHHLSAVIIARLLHQAPLERQLYLHSGHDICHSADLHPLFHDLAHFLDNPSYGSQVSGFVHQLI